jgi:predicted nucleic acid-binding Zn ribbon protein
LPDDADKTAPSSRLRETRDEQLLELGALVYELHRQGKRAPDLLQRKAGELAEVAGPLRGNSALGTCPDCGAGAESDQLVCTSCGARLALDRPRGNRAAALVALAVVALLGALATGFALSEITSDDGTPAASAPAEAPPPPSASPGAAQEPARGEGEGEDEAPAQDPAAGAPQQPRRSLLLEWPDGLTAHTVMLSTTSDRAAALQLARQAARSGIEAGLLRSDDYGLGSGLWVVFAGRFDTPEGAARQASDLAERFPGAYPQLIEPAG